jgi:hypothetical protein
MLIFSCISLFSLERTRPRVQIIFFSIIWISNLALPISNTSQHQSNLISEEKQFATITTWLSILNLMLLALAWDKIIFVSSWLIVINSLFVTIFRKMINYFLTTKNIFLDNEKSSFPPTCWNQSQYFNLKSLIENFQSQKNKYN